jgi:hypothetical protein
MRKPIAGLVIMAFVSMICVSMIAMPSPVQDRSIEITTRTSLFAAIPAPVVVVGDGAWAGAGFLGTGTHLDPWVLENFSMDCSDLSGGIIIQGTTDHFVIRNAYITNSFADALTGYGIALAPAANGLIENVTIENYQSAYAIAIAYATENVTVQNCTIQNFGAGGTNDGVIIDQAENVLIENVHFETYTGDALTIGTVFGDTNNVTIANSTFHSNDGPNSASGIATAVGLTNITNVRVLNSDFRQHDTHLDIYRTEGLLIVNNTMNMTGNIAARIHYSRDLLFENNTIYAGNTTHDENVFVKEAINATIQHNNILDDSGPYGSIYIETYAINCTIHDNVIRADFGTLHTDGIRVEQGYGNIITNNTITGWIGGSVISVVSFPGANNVIANNTIESAGTNGYGPVVDNIISVSGSGPALLIENNTFINTTRTFMYVDGGATCPIVVTRNYFVRPVPVNYFTCNMSGMNITWDSNYYQNYYDVFHDDITTDLNMTTLESDVIILPAGGNVTIMDTSPRYHAPWYPRADMVYFNFFSNVDGLGIPFSNLAVVLDGTPLTVTNPIIAHVLFRLTISDFRGRLLSDVVYNLNETGIYINIGLDIAVQIFIYYSSNLDTFGYEFTLAKLYVDNVRTPRFDPIMDHEIINFVVRDFANRILYNQTWNLTATGCYVDIGLNVTTAVIHNLFNYSVIFHYSIAGVENSFPLAGGQYFDVRVALGTYDYWVTDSHGHVIDDQDGHAIYETKSITGPVAIEFGWVTISIPPPPPPGNTTYTTSILDYIIIAMAIGGVFALVLTVNVKVKGKTKKRKKESPATRPSR